MDFSQQLIITIVDKAVIGALVAIGALLGNRYLEGFKARQTVITEFTKQRVSKISAVWEQLNLVCSRALTNHLLKGTELWEFIRSWRPEDVPRIPVDLEDTARLVTVLESLKVPPESEKRFEADLDKITQRKAGRIKALIDSINDLRVILEKERFWLQEDLYKRLMLLTLDITVIAAIDTYNQEGAVELKQKLEKIGTARQSIGSVLESALRSPLRMAPEASGSATSYQAS